MDIVQYIVVECSGMSASITLQRFRHGFRATMATHPAGPGPGTRIYKQNAKDALVTALLSSIDFFEGLDPSTGGVADEVWLTPPLTFVDLATVEKFYDDERTVVSVRTT